MDTLTKYIPSLGRWTLPSSQRCIMCERCTENPKDYDNSYCNQDFSDFLREIGLKEKLSDL